MSKEAHWHALHASLAGISILIVLAAGGLTYTSYEPTRDAWIDAKMSAIDRELGRLRSAVRRLENERDEQRLPAPWRHPGRGHHGEQ